MAAYCLRRVLLIGAIWSALSTTGEFTQQNNHFSVHLCSMPVNVDVDMLELCIHSEEGMLSFFAFDLHINFCVVKTKCTKST